ncbi:MAG: LysM peptidoglycan-binding domain-containing protein [Deltaproteobacteria bacterium]|nr:LysM peptidoglycan-binding domain-containing protein [Deltaproteobacteria bacterium]
MYNAFYGFSEKPFEAIPDPRFIYLTSHHQDILDSVTRGIEERNEFISITGAAGTGKTALFYYLLTTLEKKIKGVFIPRPFTTFRDLIRNILLELDPAAAQESKTDPFDQLMNYLNQMSARDERLVLIIDEAQSLSKELIEELEIFFNRGPKLVQIIFVGQTGLEDKLNSPGLRWLKQRIKIQLQMKSLSEEESSDYIDHRLRLVGRSILDLFTPKAISMIYNYTQGTPLGMNILCDNAFRVGYTLSRKRIDGDIIQTVINELEGPSSQKAPFHSIKKTKTVWPFPVRLKVSLKIVSFAILVLVCLGGLLLLIRGSFQQGSVKWGDFKTLKSPPLDTHPPEPKPVSPESLKLPSPPPASLTAKIKEDPLMEIVTVKAGETIYFLLQKYYRMTHTTLVDILLDFNPEITNTHLILVNQEIKIPRITEELFIIQSSESTYKIYVGTFSTPDITKIYRGEPLLAGKEIEIIPRKVSPQETWHRVVVGKFENKGEALKVIHLLKEKGMLPSFRKRTP